MRSEALRSGGVSSPHNHRAPPRQPTSSSTHAPGTMLRLALGISALSALASLQAPQLAGPPCRRVNAAEPFTRTCCLRPLHCRQQHRIIVLLSSTTTATATATSTFSASGPARPPPACSHQWRGVAAAAGRPRLRCTAASG